MSQLDETRVAIRFFGEDLDPDELTHLLGGTPTLRRRTSDTINVRGRADRFAKTGTWQLEAEPARPGDLDRQTKAIFGRLTDDLAVWKDLTMRFQADVYCGLFMRESNEGLRLAPDTLLALASRGLVLEWDIFAPRQAD
jgi:hypothetical protein